MLVLSRKESEKIRLGDSIVVTIVRVSGDKVRLGIEAPPNVVVLRDELKSMPPTISLPTAEKRDLKKAA
jgi:carbon storage regulator